MVRKIVIALLALVLIFFALRVGNRISQRAVEPRFNTPIIITPVFTQTVENTTIPISIRTSGNLRSKNRLELFSEVQGLFLESAHDFKPGTFYKSGDVLLKIRDVEERIQLQSQRSALLNQLVLLLPDLRFDYPESVPHWENYIASYDVNQILDPIPEFVNEREKLFITGKNIYASYYNVKNLESELTKFTITAPFGGVLTEALVDKGTLIRPGQKIGEFIDPYTYELGVAVNVSYGDLLTPGKEVVLVNADRSKQWKGRVIRINRTVDPGSQTIPVFIQVSGRDLREGMYLQAEVEAREIDNVFEIDRELLVDQGMVYVVDDTELVLTSINPVYFKDETVLITGLADSTMILARKVPGAYHGMKVSSLGDL
jgi:multidrug efflux pump subunit AcrA (membrane-fusion protein)